MTQEILPPEGLLSRIMRRLGLERQLRIVKQHLGFFGSLFLIFCILIVFAVIGFRQVMMESSFGQYLSLIFSDPAIVIQNWHIFALSVGESIPGVALLMLLIPFTLLLVVLRLVATPVEKFLARNKSIHTK